MKFHRIALVLAALSLVACASRPPVAYVTTSYTSSPSGALVVRDGVSLGRTPMTLIVKEPLTISGADGSITSKCRTANAVTFKWSSGAKATVAGSCQSASVNASSIKQISGSKTQYTASIQVSAARPVDAPDVNRDLRTATALSLFASVPFPAPRTDPAISQWPGVISVYGYQYQGTGNGYTYYNTTPRQ